jgi:hypothetical protein
VKNLSKCKFYKKYTPESTVNTVESSVFQSKYFHIKEYSHILHPMTYDILYARKVDLWDKIKEVKFSQLLPCVLRSYTIKAIDLIFWFPKSFGPTLYEIQDSHPL